MILLTIFRKESVRLILAFLFAFVPFIFLPVFFSFLHLTFFAPFLIIAYYKKPFAVALWFSLLCGLLMDLVSSQHHLGLHAFAYGCTTWVLYGQKRHFFEDRPSTLPIMTAFFAVLSTLIQIAMLALFEIPLPISWAWVASDLVLMPVLDALYAFVWFTLPSLFMPRIPRHEYFLQKDNK